jgi:hypothetical protein
MPRRLLNQITAIALPQTRDSQTPAHELNQPMKLALVHTPSVWVTSIPLGVAYLKAYLHRERPDVSVRILDLNNHLFKNAKQRLAGLCARCPRQADPTCVPPELFFQGDAISEAEAVFYDPAAFEDKERYAEAFAFYNEYYSWAMRCLDTVLKPFVARPDARLDPTIRALLRPDLDAIAAESPDLVGFSAMTMQIAYSLALAKLVKEELSLPIVLGGHFVSVYDPAEVMRANPFIDYIIYKEGEQGLAGLIQNLDAATFDDVPNLVHRNGDNIVVNKEGWVRKVNDLPFPDLADYQLGSYFSPSPVVPILFSRGCHWGNCAFCEESTAITKYRTRTPENVVDEMEQRIQDNAVRYFLFCDQTITATSLERLADEILARGLDVRYGFSGFYASRQVTREVLEKAHVSGCRWLYIGAESLTQRLIELMAKGTEAGHVLDVIRWCREIGILPFTSYFFGFPTQTADEVKQEARIAKDNAAFFTIPGDGGEFYLTAGSAICRHPEKYSVDQIETHAAFATPTGTITSISPRYRAPGLSGSQAKRLFLETVGDDYPYEAGAFWSHFVILGDHNVDLVFPREYYRARLARPMRRFADTMRQRGAVMVDEQGPHVAKLNYHLGLLYASEGDNTRALAPLRRAAQLASESPAALRALAASALEVGNHAEALQAAERAIALGEDDIAIHTLVASCHECRNDPAAALETYRRLTRRFPTKVALLREIGRLSKLAGARP